MTPVNLLIAPDYNNLSIQQKENIRKDVPNLSDFFALTETFSPIIRRRFSECMLCLECQKSTFLINIFFTLIGL